MVDRIINEKLMRGHKHVTANQEVKATLEKTAAAPTTTMTVMTVVTVMTWLSCYCFKSE